MLSDVLEHDNGHTVNKAGWRRHSDYNQFVVYRHNIKYYYFFFVSNILHNDLKDWFNLLK